MKNYELEEKEKNLLVSLHDAFKISYEKNKDNFSNSLIDKKVISDFKNYNFKIMTITKVINTEFNKKFILEIRKEIKDITKFCKTYKNTLDFTDLEKVLFPLSDKQTFNRL